ncbi:10 TM acyl transferase domain found in Cas1p-domain-containing protein [Blakeslea trispora]|nr:10 TM acyl transferase domain found in Cas1p-domain-containing protein [Blakeslea trispora]
MTLKKEKPFSTIAKGIALSTLIAILCMSLTKYVLDPQDNTRCKSMLNEGKWLTEEYKQWQPNGCMAKTYRKEDIGSCLGHSRIVYIGDSIMREQYYAMTSFLRPHHKAGTAVHEDQKEHYANYNLTIEMWWDPYLNSSKTVDLLEAKQQTSRPSLLVIGSGIWYMRRLGPNYFPLWKQAVDKIFDGALHHTIADRIMVSPVETVEYDLMIPERKATLTSDKITLMNNYLRDREANLDQPTTPLVVPFVWNKIVASSKNQTKDGLHFKEPVTRAEAQLALNYRCNNDPSVKKDTYPVNSTCCYSYASPLWYQNTILIFFLCFIPLYLLITNLFSEYTLQWTDDKLKTNFELLKALFIFGLAVAYMFMGDRTQLFGKIFKQFDALTFSILTMLVLILGGVTLKSSKDTNGFLNRHQTEEWKGWMQLVILIYHFTGASRIPGIYNPIRVLVAAYLFQTGYGHFFYFYKKKDFGVARILNVLVRLNLLSCVLAYVMRTDYLFYYFSPLVSFWFAVIWLTMRILSSHNQKVWFMVSKIALMSLLTALLIHYPGLLESVFSALHWLFKIQWNVVEWRFRLALDCWIVYVGMLCALVTIKISEYEIDPRTWSNWKIGSIILSVIGLSGYFCLEVLQSKTEYNTYHPYISWIPIISFIILRNATLSARSTYSNFFAFIGKISLETFIGQFHMWLAADTQGLLVVLPSHWVRSSLGWWSNLMVSSIVFFFVCYYLSWATGSVTRWLCSGAQTSHSSNDNINLTADAVPLLPTTDQHVHTEKSQKGTVEEAERGCSSDEISLDAWEEPVKSSPAWYETLYYTVYQSYLIRSLFFLVTLGIVNRFCT